MLSLWSPPEEFDGYRLGKLLGRGGMGQVYLAQDTLLERAVAIKFISHANPDPEMRRRFIVEARAIARLQHPNVVSVYRAGEVAGCPYLVSEFVRGESLDKLNLPVPWQRVLQIGLELARGLATAHRHGVLHRDIKPANAILSVDGEVKLLDFGLAKLLESKPGAPAGGLLPALAGAVHSAESMEFGETADLTVAARETPVAAETPVTGETPALNGPTPQGGRPTPHERVVGTPAYMAPEVWRGEPATFASDIYSVGALLYELCTGHPPHDYSGIASLVQAVLSKDARPLAEVVPGIDEGLASVIDRCLRRDRRARYANGNELRVALAQLTPESRDSVVPEGNPYRGLHAFDAEHRGFFFGRDSEIRGVLERLAAESFVLVAGDSGVGKSSLCRAGILPRVGEWLEKRRQWSSVALVPGKHPVASLCVALAPLLRCSEQELASRLTADPSCLGRELRSKLGQNEGLVIFFDQLEELVTLAPPDEAETVAQAIAWLVSPTPGVKVLATVRGDFLSRLASLPPVVELISRALYFLRPLSPDRVHEAIVGPCQATGFSFEDEAMVEELVQSTVQAAGSLPLLQFALARLWEGRDHVRHVLSRASLQALGGVAGALSRHADEVLERMLPEEREAARRILLMLVTAENTRARRTAAEVGAGDSHVAAALDGLVRGRLVVATDTANGASYEIAHEALIHGWATLSRWLAADTDLRILRERLAQAVTEWERLGRSSDALWSSRHLGEVKALRLDDLPPAQLAFVQASMRAVRRARILKAAALTGIPLLLVLTYGGVQLETTRDLRRQVDAHVAAARSAMQEAGAERAEGSSLRKEAFALFDRGEGEAAEKRWGEARAALGKLGNTLARASQSLELAVLLDKEREDVRALFAETLLERALLAEENHDAADREEMLQRMALYDDDGARLARWRTPGLVTLEVEPMPDRVTLERYDEGPERALRPADIPLPAPLPWDGVRLERGSYRLTLEKAGHATVRYPFVVERGQGQRIELRLPRAGRVPAGFVPVLPGRFEFGASVDDGLRKSFFHAVPQHRVETKGYLIAEHETTFAEWIEYLQALPPREREGRLPKVGKGGFEGMLSLRERPGAGWELTLQPSSQAHTAVWGEPLRYPARKQRAAQAWERFPVSGISVADAKAYAAWLDASGKVPGARLCTDHEWERAARGADARDYPHGLALLPDDANIDDTYGKVPEAMGPDEVGSHPASASPFGLQDMAGNLWEWTVSSVKAGEHAARGGSYYFGVNSARVFNRETPEPSFRDTSVGMRVCADLPPD